MSIMPPPTGAGNIPLPTYFIGDTSVEMAKDPASVWRPSPLTCVVRIW